jgi:hypothetical protein
VHPAILEAYLDGKIGGALLEAAEEQRDPSAPDPETKSRGGDAASSPGCGWRSQGSDGRAAADPHVLTPASRTMASDLGSDEWSSGPCMVAAVSPTKRHHPTDITREDMQRAADGSGITSWLPCPEHGPLDWRADLAGRRQAGRDYARLAPPGRANADHDARPSDPVGRLAAFEGMPGRGPAEVCPLPAWSAREAHSASRLSAGRRSPSSWADSQAALVPPAAR